MKAIIPAATRIALPFVFLLALCPADARSQTIIETVPLPNTTYWNSAYGLASDSFALYVGSATSTTSLYNYGRIYKLDLHGILLDSTSTTLGSSQGLAFDDTNFYYVRRYTSFCTVIRITPAGTVVDSMRFSSPARYLGGAAWDGTHLWISQYYPNPGKLYKINWSTKTIVDSIMTIGDQPEGVAWDGKYLYYAMDIFSGEPNQNLIYVVDPVSHDTVKTIPMPEGKTVDSNPTGLTWDGNNLWLIARPVGGGSTKVLYKYDLSGGGTPGITIPVSFIDFGWVPIGDTLDLQASIQSSGTDTLVIDSVKIAYSSSFTPDLPTPLIIPNGTTHNFFIRFMPVSYGTDSAHITLYHNDVTKPPQKIRVVGRGMYPPAFIEVPPVHDFSTRRKGSTNSWKLTIENRGAASLTILSAMVSTSDYSVQVGAFPMTINPVSSKTVRIWFTPHGAGLKTDTLILESNAGNLPTARITLTGQGDPTPLPLATPMWNYTVPDHPASNTYRTVKAVRSIGDITGDGKPDVIVSTENYWTMALNGNSSVDNDSLWAFTTYISSYSAGTIGTTGDYSYQKALAIASDLNSDGYNDVVIGTGGGNEHVYAINGKTGQMLWTFGTDHPDSFGLGDITGVDASRDFNGDGIPDVVAAASASVSGGTEGRRSAYLFNGTNGAILWQAFLGGFTHGLTSIGDISGDGIPDVIATIGEPVYAAVALRGNNGSVMWTYPFTSGSGGGKEVMALPDTGSAMDVIVSAFWGPVVRLDGQTGGQVWLTNTGGLPNGCVTQFARLRDITGDGIDEILASLLGNGVWCLDGATGSVLWSQPTGNTMGIASVADLDGDGTDEAVVASQNSGTIIATGDSGQTLGQYPFGGATQTREVSAVPDMDGNLSPEMIAGSNLGNVVLLSGGLDVPPIEIADTVAVHPRWNLISVPLLRDDNRVSSIYPTANPGTTVAFYDTGYVHAETLIAGNGYWTKFPDAVDQPITGVPMSMISVSIRNGWNLIGSVDHEIPIPGDGFIMSPVFDYDSGFTIVNSIKPGKGHWIKSNADTTLLLGGSSHAKSGCSTNFAEGNEIVIVDATGGRQVLHLVPVGTDGGDPRLFELPPPAPGMFDARFVTQRMLEFYADTGSGSEEYPVMMRNVRYPVTVRYIMRSAGGIHIELLVREGNALVRTAALRGRGALVVERGMEGSIALRIIRNGDVPDAYALHQNYPNPFNPRTVIRYELPVESHVRVVVYDILGRQVAQLRDGIEQEGYRSVIWDAAGYATGVYYYRITAVSTSGIERSFDRVRTMILMK